MDGWICDPTPGCVLNSPKRGGKTKKPRHDDDSFSPLSLSQKRKEKKKINKKRREPHAIQRRLPMDERLAIPRRMPEEQLEQRFPADALSDCADKKAETPSHACMHRRT